MKLIESSVEVYKQNGYTLQYIYKQIEIAGRTCYKSEENITEDSAESFVNRMIKSGHGAMLEHGTVYLHLTMSSRDRYFKYCTNPYAKTTSIGEAEKQTWEGFITTNFRVLVENDWLDDLQYLCSPTKCHEKRISVKWHCDRVTGESFLRHRVFSFARESTRYCNFSKGKFNSEITLIKPSWWTTDDDAESTLYLEPFRQCEHFYMTLIENGVKPQYARQVLPFALYSPLVMTGFESDWEHFFKLRRDKAAHPDAQKLANELWEKLYETRD